MENVFAQLDQLLLNLHHLTGYGFVWKRSQHCLTDHRLQYCKIHRCEFCDAFKKKNGIRDCLCHDFWTIPEYLGRSGNKAFEMICPAGAMELIIPIVRDEHIYGVVLAGPFSPPGKICPGLPEWKIEQKTALVQMVRYLVNPLASGLARRNTLPKVKDPRIKEVLDYLDLHFQENPDISFLADMVYLSASRFSHLFRQECGMYLSAYLNELKLTVALELLRNNSNSIAETANACGFSDPNHFATCFKKKFKKTPREIRKDWHNELHGN